MRKPVILFSLVALSAATLIAGCTASRHTSAVASPGIYSPDSVFGVMKKVADWQLAHFYPYEKPQHELGDWHNGALYAGIMAFGKIAGDTAYYSRMKAIGDELHWQLYHNADRYFADRYCVGQMYAQLYMIYHQPEMIADLKELADSVIARPHTESLEWKNKISLREWAWCDALFMGPPPLAYLATATHDIKYLDIVDKLWWKTTDYLYDPAEHLYFRDGSFLNKKEKNGKKVFWSRGNGWVMGGLVRVLENMPANYPDRDRWIKLYRDMASKVASLQQPDGTWHASLLDPESYPVKETSGSGFFCYALAWGINHGLIPRKKFEPVVLKAWSGLTSCVHPNGKLGYVQAVGAAPQKVGYDDTEVYGVGAFLLAGTEVLGMVK
ncbi:MAG TPA: glycoside hydrolase family 88 protein [Chitinophagaceae bacterium]